MPAGALDLTGADVHIVVIDAAGNQGTVVQHVRYDATPPTVTLLSTSQVHDEASETPTFSSSPAARAPMRFRATSTVVCPTFCLSTGMCPSITKYSYLLGANPPPYGTEPNGRNPSQYQLLAADDGIGIDPAATQYRVGRDDASGATQWITAFTSAGTGTPVPGNPGVTGYTVPIYADAVPGLDTLEGVYHVQFQSTDSAGPHDHGGAVLQPAPARTAAPPWDDDGQLDDLRARGCAGPSICDEVLSLAPGATFNQIAARVLNVSAAASLLDMPVINGTASTVYLTVNVTSPGSGWTPCSTSRCGSWKQSETSPASTAIPTRLTPAVPRRSRFPASPRRNGQPRGGQPAFPGLWAGFFRACRPRGIPLPRRLQDADSTFRFALPHAAGRGAAAGSW